MKDRKNLIVVKKGAICTVIINNTRKCNALTPECLFDITQAFNDLAHDQDIKVTILRVPGKKPFLRGQIF
jgi:enoyl-CoA hydratase/carnithine racemase